MSAVRVAVWTVVAIISASLMLARPVTARAASGWVEVQAVELGEKLGSPVPRGYVLVLPADAAAQPVELSDVRERYAFQLDESGHTVVEVAAPGSYAVALVAASPFVEYDAGHGGKVTITVKVEWHPTPLVLEGVRVDVGPGETVSVRITVRTPKPNIPPEMVPTPPSLGNAGLLASADETAADHPEGLPSPGRTAERTTTRSLAAVGLALGLAGLLLAVAGWTKDARRRTRPRN